MLRCGDFWRIVSGEEFHDIFSSRQDFKLSSTGEIYASLKFIVFFLTKHFETNLVSCFPSALCTERELDTGAT